MNDADTSPAALLAHGAVSVCEMSSEPEQRREQLLLLWGQFGSEPGLLQAAAEKMAGLRQPLADKVEQSDRKARAREVWGAPSPEDGLLAMLDARALLEELAREFD